MKNKDILELLLEALWDLGRVKYGCSVQGFRDLGLSRDGGLWRLWWNRSTVNSSWIPSLLFMHESGYCQGKTLSLVWRMQELHQRHDSLLHPLVQGYLFNLLLVSSCSVTIRRPQE